MKPRKLLIAFLLIILLFTFVILRNQAYYKNNPTVPSSKAFSVVISGESSGLALFSPKGNMVEVGLTTANLATQRVTIETGNCKEKTRRLFDLGEVINGKLETQIGSSITYLEKLKPISIKIHSESSTSCGQLPL